MSFLDPNYQIPQSPSSYMKLKQGKNRFRILSPAIIGWLYWNKDNKPVRSRKQFDIIPLDIKIKDDGTYSEIKHFWSFAVWNYDLNMVQILELTQKSIMTDMKSKIENRDGNATENDFVITRSGEGFNTEYDVDVLDRSPIPTDAVVAYKSMKINLDALFDGGDPFKGGQTSEDTKSSFQHISEAPSEAKNAMSSYEKLKAQADKLSPQNKLAEEQISPDIQAMADEMAEDVPFNENEPPF
jgi:hypothetical protein